VCRGVLPQRGGELTRVELAVALAQPVLEGPGMLAALLLRRLGERPLLHRLALLALEATHLGLHRIALAREGVPRGAARGQRHGEQERAHTAGAGVIRTPRTHFGPPQNPVRAFVGLPGSGVPSPADR